MPSRDLPQDPAGALTKAFQEAALRKFPNPQRNGCPNNRNVLQAIARRNLRPSNPVVQHVAECSPCLNEIAQIRLQNLRRHWLLGGAVAALLVMSCGIALLKHQDVGFVPSTAQSLVIDLRDLSTSRGETDRIQLQDRPISIGRGDFHVSILLPVGSPEGEYSFKISDESLQPKLSGSWQAHLQQFNIVISAHIDTRRFSPGQYSLLIRQGDGDWQSFQLVIH